MGLDSELYGVETFMSNHFLELDKLEIGFLISILFLQLLYLYL